MTYIPGDFWRICDVCGFKMRASASRRRWDNLMVCAEDYEERHPQDFVRGRKDHQIVPDPRPMPVDVVVGPLVTTTSAAAVAGATTVNLTSALNFEVGDRIGITLASGEVFRATVQTVPTTTQITLSSSTKLPGPVSSGANVVNYSAVSTPSYE